MKLQHLILIFLLLVSCGKKYISYTSSHYGVSGTLIDYKINFDQNFRRIPRSVSFTMSNFKYCELDKFNVQPYTNKSENRACKIYISMMIESYLSSKKCKRQNICKTFTIYSDNEKFIKYCYTELKKLKSEQAFYEKPIADINYGHFEVFDNPSGGVYTREDEYFDIWYQAKVR